MLRLLQLLAPIALVIAGIVHLIIAPDHFAHAPAHGMFFALAGLAQLGWAGWVLTQRGVLHPLAIWFGALLSGGMVLIWLLVHFISTPFAVETHAVDWATIVTKAAEVAAFVLLFVSLIATQPHPRQQIPGLALGLLAGALMWGAAIAVTPLLPMLSESGHAHDHDHGAATVGMRSTAAYFTIVNSGGAPDTLVSAASPDIPAVTLHETTIDAQAVASMDALEGVPLHPHLRVEFTPAGRHVMLEGLTRDLYAGDHLTLTLNFASGRSVEVDFIVSMETPSTRLNFMAIDDFQISNAWIRATASLDGLVTVSAQGYDWQLPSGFPPPRVPANNPMTAEKAELGRLLFYDVRLSGSGTMSCSSCHLQELAFTDGRPLAIGATGDIHPRNSPTLVNAAYNATLTWANPTLLELERQIPLPMFGEHPVEMGITGMEAEVLARFRDDSAYQERFASAFPDEEDPFTFQHITQALASFVRTLISGGSDYDRYIQGDEQALSESARRGMELFLSEGLECHHCHTGFNFTLSTMTANSTFEDYPFFNTGLYNVDGRGAYPSINTGVYEITHVTTDMGRFRPPTLRNIALTAPYMHDGSIATLREVLQTYMAGGRQIVEGENAGDGRANPYKSGLVAGFTLSEGEMEDLLAFLHSLTDETFITDPRFSDPFAQIRS